MQNFKSFLDKLSEISELISPIKSAYSLIFENSTEETVRKIKEELSVETPTPDLTQEQLKEIELLDNLY